MIQVALLAAIFNKVGTQRIFAFARTGAYAGAVLATVGLVGAHKAHASLEATGLKVSSDLMAVSPLLQDGTALDVNGQRLHFSTAKTLDGTKAVLDQFQSSCELAAGGDVPVWDSIPTSKKDPRLSGVGKMPILRSEEGDHGYILCMVPTAQMTREGFLSSVKNFMEHGGSLDVGKLRYATVKSGAEGSAVMTFWTDDSFDVSALLPDPNHDKPGTDPGVMLRPQSSTRMLAATAEQVPYKVYLYQTKQTPLEAIKSYDDQMIAAGWVSIAHPQMAVVPHEGFEAHAYMRDGFIGYLTTTTSPTGATLIGIGETAKVDAKADLKLSQPTRDADGF